MNRDTYGSEITEVSLSLKEIQMSFSEVKLLIKVLHLVAVQFSSVQSIMSNSLWPHGVQEARLSCPSPTPRACSNSWPLSRWCHTTISSTVIPFSSCRLFFTASGSFQTSPFFVSGGQSIGVSSFSISPSSEYSGLISFRIDCFETLTVQGTLKSLLQHHSLKA